MTDIVTRRRLLRGLPRGGPRRAALALGASAVSVLALGALAAPARAQQQPPVRPAAEPGGLRTLRALSLDDAIQLAERESEAIRIAEAGVQRSRGQQLQARSQYFPQLNAAVNYQRALQNQFQAISERVSSGNNNQGGGAPGDSTGGGDDLANNPLTRIFASPYTLTLNVTGSQTLFSGGRVQAANRAAEAGRRAAEIGVAAARAQLALDVAQAYYDAVLSDRLIAVAESSLVQTERTFRQTSAARQVGNTSEFELLRARVQRDNQRPVLIQARTQRDVAYLRLKQLLNVPVAEPVRLTTDLPMTPSGGAATPLRTAAADASAVDRTGVIPARLESVAVDPAAAVAEDPRVGALVDSVVGAADTVAARRSSARQARENVEAQRSQLRVVRAQRLPAVQLSTTYQRFAYPSNGLPTALDQFFPNWTVSLGVSLPLFTGGRIRGEELAAQANVREAEQQAQQVEELAALDAQLAVAQLEQAEAAWLASAGTAEQASRAYQISEVRYREGIATQIELADSRLLLQQSQWNTATAARDLEIARLRLRLLRDLPLQAAGAGAQQQLGGGAGGAGGAAGGAQQQTPRQNQAPQGPQAGGAATGPFGGGNQ